MHTADQRAGGDDRQLGHVPRCAGQPALPGAGGCLYEWKAVPDGKQPFAIARADGQPLAFAGLWESWRDPEGEVFRTFTIATTAASVDMAQLHYRMPVILEPAS